MARRWPKDLVCKRKVLEVENPWCRRCGSRLYKCDHRHHRIFTLTGPVQLICKLVRCSNKVCSNHRRTLSPESEMTWTMPRWTIGWDVFCWIGHRRVARHWSIPQIRGELMDSYRIPLSKHAIGDYLQLYQQMLAARQQDMRRLHKEYQGTRRLLLAIDGLQPEKGHETLYVVRELGRQRVWFAEPLLSSSASEVRRLLVQARQWAELVDKPVGLWMSDKQNAFVKGIAAEFAGVAHRYCQNHFLRDFAKPVLEIDSHAKVQMRSKIRGLRALERALLEQQRRNPDKRRGGKRPAGDRPNEEACTVVLDYCTAVRGILNNNQGGPLRPPGLRMAEALGEVRRSLARNIRAKKGGLQKVSCNSWPPASIGRSTTSWKV